MKLTQWNRPESSLTAIERDLTGLFDSLFRGDLAVWNEELRVFAPKINVTQSDKELAVSAELPGLDEKDVQVQLTDDRLVLAGEKRVEQEEKDRQGAYVERSYGRFERIIALPEGLDTEKAEATFKRGVLRIVIPRRADAKPAIKTLPIKSE